MTPRRSRPVVLSVVVESIVVVVLTVGGPVANVVGTNSLPGTSNLGFLSGTLFWVFTSCLAALFLLPRGSEILSLCSSSITATTVPLRVDKTFGTKKEIKKKNQARYALASYFKRRTS